MKKFLSTTGIFSLSLVITLSVLVFCSSFYARTEFDFKIAANKTTLVLGNSHPEHSINDSKLNHVYNLAQSGSAYFYDYLKLREIIKHNPHINHVVLGYSYTDIHSKMDSWFNGNNQIKHKFRNFFFLLDFKDYLEVFKANPKGVLLSTPQTIFQNLIRKLIGFKGLGGYLKTDVHELETAKQRMNGHYRDTTEGLSTYQTKYLIKIYKLCKKNKIKLVLINTPIHPDLQEIQEPLKLQYCNFAKNSLPEALLIDHSNFIIPDKGFRDLDHLNTIGAELYSSYLVSNKFKFGQKTCYSH